MITLNNLQYANALKTSSKRLIQKTAEATGDLAGNKIMGVSRNLQQSNSETVTNKHDKEIPKERYICSEERQKTIDDLRLILWYNNGMPKNKKFF